MDKNLKTIFNNYYKLVAKPMDGHYENGEPMDKNFMFYSSVDKPTLYQFISTTSTMAKNNHLSSLEVAIFNEDNRLCCAATISKEFLKDLNVFDFESILLNDLNIIDQKAEQIWLNALSSDSFINKVAFEINDFIYEIDPYEYNDQYVSRSIGFEATKAALIDDATAIQDELLSYIESLDPIEEESIQQIQSVINLVDLVSYALENETRKPSLVAQMMQGSIKAKTNSLQKEHDEPER